MSVDTFTAPKSIAMIARILAELTKLPMTRDELQCLMRCSKPTIRRYIAHLRSENRIHIARWKTSNRGRFAPVHAVGCNTDAKEPVALTKTERNAMRWKLVKADRDRHDRVKSQARVAANIQRVRAKPVTWFGALPGAQDIKQEVAP